MPAAEPEKSGLKFKRVRNSAGKPLWRVPCDLTYSCLIRVNPRSSVARKVFRILR